MATQQPTDKLHAAKFNFLMGFDLTETIRHAILDLPERAWWQAIRQDGEDRDGAWVAEYPNRTVTTRDAISIAIPAVALLIVLAVPGPVRPARRPWFTSSKSPAAPPG